MVTTDWVFMAAMSVSFAAAMTDYSIDGVVGISDNITESLDFSVIDGRYDTFGRSNAEIITMVEWESRTTQQQLNTYNNQIDNRSDAQIRNGHRTWSQRAADPDYADPAAARDFVAVFEMALEDRGLEPHAGY